MRKPENHFLFDRRIGVQLYYVTIMSKESITADGKMVVCVWPFANNGWQVAVDMTSCGQQLETVANFQLAIYYKHYIIRELERFLFFCENY